jgi:hypothetical protein
LTSKACLPKTEVLGKPHIEKANWLSLFHRPVGLKLSLKKQRFRGPKGGKLRDLAVKVCWALTGVKRRTNRFIEYVR